VKYEVVIEMTYLGGRSALSEDARRVLGTSMLSDLASRGHGRLVITAFELTAEPDGQVRVRAGLAGAGPADLTSPIAAATYVDAALTRALIMGGLFEEFDVARRSLTIHSGL
jgi:hypothetical protein